MVRWAGANGAQCAPMLRSGIALMGSEAVFRVAFTEFYQLRVSGHLGDNGGGRNRGDGFIALHNGLGGQSKLWHFVAVHEHAIWLDGKTRNSTAHSQVAGA